MARPTRILFVDGPPRLVEVLPQVRQRRADLHAPTSSCSAATSPARRSRRSCGSPDGSWRCRFIGVDYHIEDGPELDALERLIEDHGYYPYRAEPGEVEALVADGGFEALFATLMEQRLAAWLSLADERLRPAGTPLFLMLGNDDPISLRPLLDAAPWGTHAEGRVVMLDEATR